MVALRCQSKSLKPYIHYVFMAFPVPSESFARVELRGLLDAGCRVSVSTLRSRPKDAGKFLDEHQLQDVDISYGGFWKSLRGFQGLVRRPVAAAGLIRTLALGFKAKPMQTLIGLLILPRAFGIALELQKSSPDRVHLFWGHYPSLVGLALKRMNTVCPVSMFLGAYDLVLRFPPSAVLARQVPVMTHSHDNVAPICEFTGLSPQNVKVIHRGIRLPACPSPKSRQDFYHIVMAERLIRDKYTEDGIEVFARVLGQMPESRLTILGDGPERTRLARLVEDKGLADSVRFLGHVTHDRVQAEMARAGVFMTMSRSPSERIPNSAKEAMAAGCPVVASATPGIDELVANGITGYVVSVGDIEAAATRILELLHDGVKLNRIAQAGSERVNAMFNVASTTQQRLDFWRIGEAHEAAAAAHC